MSSLWRDLLCLHGHIHDWALIRRLGASRTHDAQPSEMHRGSAPGHPDSAPRQHDMLCLGIGDGTLRHR